MRAFKRTRQSLVAAPSVGCRSSAALKQGIEQAARTYGILRSLKLIGALIYGLVECIATKGFR